MLKKINLTLLLIILLGLGLRLYKLNLPLMEFYPSRQIQTADITRNFIKNDFNLFKPTVTYLGRGYTPFLVEFPGYNFAVAAIYYFFGVNEIYGRLFSLAGWVISIFLLYKITFRLFSRTSALIAIFFYALSPLSVLVSRSFQPDQWMLALSLASIYFIIKWKESQKMMLFTISMVCASLAFLLKTQSIIFTIIPISFAILTSAATRSKFLFVFYVFLSFLPVTLWTVFAMIQNRATSSTSGVFTLSNYFGWDIFLNPKYYSNIFGFEYNLVLLPVGMMLFMLGILTKLAKKQYILYSWLVSVILYFMTFNKLNMTHEYYHLPILPIASLFIGIAGEKVLSATSSAIIPKKIALLVFSAILLLLMIIPTEQRAYSLIDRFNFVTTTANAIKKVTKPSDLIIGSMDAGPALVYYSDRHGWGFDVQRQDIAGDLAFYGITEVRVNTAIEELARLKSLGATIFASADKGQFLSNKDFASYMYANFNTIEDNNNYVIFDLRFKRI